jgi:hypothetical protein
MSVASGDLGDVTGGHVKIGAASHAARNIAIVVGAVVLGIAIVAFTSLSRGQDAEKLSKLESFRAAYAEKCDAASFRGEAAPLLRDTYLKSDRLQAVVEKQHSALKAGAPCEEIGRALRSADFPMPAGSVATQQ